MNTTAVTSIGVYIYTVEYSLNLSDGTRNEVTGLIMIRSPAAAMNIMDSYAEYTFS